MTTETARPHAFAKWLQQPAKFSPECVLLVIAVLSRLIPHAPNFTAVGAVAVFAGYFFHRRREALVVSLGAMLISDVFAGFYSSAIWVYGAFALSVMLGRQLRGAGAKPGRFSWPSTAMVNVSAAVVFFVLSNFGVWASSGMYSLDWTGLVHCFTAAIPFFGNTLASQLIFGAALFAAHRALRKKALSWNV